MTQDQSALAQLLTVLRTADASNCQNLWMKIV
jgi:hypothetical protein